MDKVRKPNISVCYTPSSEPYSKQILFQIFLHVNFCCGLFNNAFNIDTADLLMVRWLLIEEFGRIWKETVVTKSRYPLSICREGEAMNILWRIETRC
jgi:hypothetical protein